MGMMTLKTRQLIAGMFLMGLSALASAEMYTLNFKNADINELIKFVADATKLTMVIDPKVKGKIEIISAEQVNQTQLYDLFLSVLEVHGFSAVKTGNVVRIIRERDARSSAGPVIGTEQIDYDNEFVTEVVQLENVNAAKLIPILRPLVPQQNHMAAYADSNAIIVASSVANIARIKQIIERIDKAAVQETELVKLEHASAEDVVRILEQMQQTIGAGDKKAPVTKRVQMVADKRTNTIIISGDPVYRAKLVALAKKLDSPLESIGNARVVYLKYAKAKDLAEVLTKVVQNMSKLESGATKSKTARANNAATIEADEATNSLIITAEADVLPSLEAIIARLDIRRAQVLVEAVIVEVQDNDGKALGVDWMYANDHGGFGGSSLSSDGTLAAVAGAAFEEDVNDKLTGLAGALAGQTGGVFGIGTLKKAGTSLAGIVQLLQTETESNILSTPSVLTMDNHEASIVVGQEVPFVTGSYTATGNTSSTPGNPFQTVDRQNVGITLKVTPRISEGNNVELELSQEISNIVGSTSDFNSSNVITNERKIDTVVTTGDGEVVVLGGLIQDRVNETERKIPLLGDIPLLGRLFRSNSTSVEKTNLLVFIQPTILRDAASLKQLSSDKYNNIRDQQLEKLDRGVDLFRDDVLPLLPEWENQVREIETIRQQDAAEAAAAQ